jgi:hypothetical protein
VLARNWHIDKLFIAMSFRIRGPLFAATFAVAFALECAPCAASLFTRLPGKLHGADFTNERRRVGFSGWRRTVKKRVDIHTANKSLIKAAVKEWAANHFESEFANGDGSRKKLLEKISAGLHGSDKDWAKKLASSVFGKGGGKNGKGSGKNGGNGSNGPSSGNNGPPNTGNNNNTPPPMDQGPWNDPSGSNGPTGGYTPTNPNPPYCPPPAPPYCPPPDPPYCPPYDPPTEPPYDPPPEGGDTPEPTSLIIWGLLAMVAAPIGARRQHACRS